MAKVTSVCNLNIMKNQKSLCETCQFNKEGKVCSVTGKEFDDETQILECDNYLIDDKLIHFSRVERR